MKTPIRRVVARGLAAEPEARWPSMDAVVAELERERDRIITTWTPGGCQAERIVWLEAE